MAKKKKFGASLRQQVDLLPIVKEKAPKTISTNVSTGGMRSAVSSTTQSVAKSARQKAEEDRSARMRQGLSSIARSSFNRQFSKPTYVNRSRLLNLNKNPLAPVKSMRVTGGHGMGEQRQKILFTNEKSLLKNTQFITGGHGVGESRSALGAKKTDVLQPVKKDIRENYYDAVRKVGMKGSRNERKVYRPMWQRDEEGQVSSNQRRLENAARGGNRKAQVEAEMGRTKARTVGGRTYDQFINAELNKKGLLGQDYILRGKDPSQEAIDYRNKYGFDEEALNQIKAIADNAPASGDYTERFNGQDNGSVLDRIKFGLDESWRARDIEDTYQRMYGKSIDDDTQAKLDAVRDSGGYMVGNMLGQASQFAMTAPLSPLVEQGLMARMGLKGGRAAINTTKDAVKYAIARIGADQVVSAPVNMIDALKGEDTKDVALRFFYNTGLDVLFGGLLEIPSLRTNAKFVKAIRANDAANAMEEGAEQVAAKVAAEKQLSEAISSFNPAEQRAIRNRMRQLAEEADIQRDINRGFAGDTSASNLDIYNEELPSELSRNEARRLVDTEPTPNELVRERAGNFRNNSEMLFQDGGIASREAVNASIRHGVQDSDYLTWRMAYDAARRNGMVEDDAIRYADDYIVSSAERARLVNREPVDTLAVANEEARRADSLLNAANGRETRDSLLDAANGRENRDVLLDAANRRRANEPTILSSGEAPRSNGTFGRDVTAKYNESLEADKNLEQAIANYDKPLTELSDEESKLWDDTYGEAYRRYSEYPDARQRAMQEADDAVKQRRNIELAQAATRADEARRAINDLHRTPREAPVEEPKAPREAPAKESNVQKEEPPKKREKKQKQEPKEEQKTKALNSVTDEEIDRLVREQTKEMYDKMSTEELSAELRRLKKNPTVTPDVEGAEEMGIKEAMDSDEVAQRTEVINEILNERRANGSVKQRHKAKANAESEAAEKEAKRIEAYNLYKQVDKEFKDAIRKRSYKGNTLRAYPRADDMRIIYMDDAYDENGFRRLIREDIEKANAQKVETPRAKATNREPKAKPNVDRSREAWDNIEGITDKAEKPKDLMRERPTRNEPAIPKASDQKTRKEVLFRGETAERNGVKEATEQTAQEAPKKRNQVKGVLGNEKPKTEEPKTKFSEMNDHELQSERYRYEEQSKYDKTAGTSEDRIAEIDEEFAKRGKEPKWTRVEPEQGGKRVMSEEEVARAKKEQGEKYGTYENKTPKKTDTPDGAKRVHKTFDREVEKQSAEVQHEMGNELFGEHAHTSDGKTVDEFVEEFNNKFNENPEAYSRKLVDDNVEMDYRERQVGLFMAKGQWRDEVNSLERKLQKANLDADVKRSLEDRLATASEMERITTEKYVKIVPEAASILKIHGVLNKLSKHTKGEYIDETIRRMEKKYRKRLDKFGIDHIYVSDELRDALKNAKEPIEISQAWMEITAELWDQIPASTKEKLDFFRVNAMLFNLPTHIRNFAGNVLFAPLREAKNLQAAGLEKVAQKLNLIDQSDRTKAFIPKPALKKRGKELRKKYGEVINEGFKFFDDIADGRPHGRKVFMAGRQNGHGLAFMNGIRRGMDFLGNANLKALSAEDKVMFSSAFDTAFAREATARGLSPEDLINNPKLEQRIIEDAATEALRATFNDVSAFTRALSKIANPGENAHITRKIIGLTVNAIQPFIKVPVNILRRGIDYSPFGWGKGIYNIGKGWHMHDPKMITKGIDQLASGTTGTAVALTGWLLAKHDRINAQIGNDDDEMFMKDLGKQKFSIVLKKDGDKEFSYSIDWAQPGAIPLFWGVALERISEEGLQNVNLWEVADLFEAAFEPVEELSVLQGLKNTSETFQDEDNWVKGVESVIINTGFQYVGQFLPTSVKRVARQVDPIRRDTSSHAEESTKRTVEKWWNKQRAGIPSNPVTDALHISSTSLPAYKNAWGEVQSNTYSKDWKGRVLENFASPGYLKDYKPDEVDKFLLDMYNKDKSAKDLFPERNWKGTVSFKGQNVKLTSDELDYYDRLAGQESKKEIKRRLDAGDFEGLSLSEQRKIVRDIYADANLKATQKTLLKQGKDPWDVYSDSLSDTQKNYKDIKATGIKPETYYQYATTDAHDLNENGYTSKAEWVMYLNKQDLTDEQRAALYPLRATGDNPYLDGTAYTKNWEKENEKNLSKSSKAAATKFEKATPRDAGSIAANLFDKSVIQRAGEMRAAADASSSGSSGSSGGSKKGRSGRRSGGSSGKTKARAKTESEKKFAALQKMKAPTTGKGIEALSQGAKGLTKAQKKALIKLLQKKLDV